MLDAAIQAAAAIASEEGGLFLRVMKPELEKWDICLGCFLEPCRRDCWAWITDDYCVL